MTGLNDLVITKGALSRLISLEIYQENGLVDHYLSDGVIFPFRFFAIFITVRSF